MNEFETVAWIKQNGIARQFHVTVSFELDGFKPLGLWVEDEHGNDVTLDIEEAEYDLLYEKACKKAVEDMVCAAEYEFEGER